MPDGNIGGAEIHWRSFGHGPARALFLHPALAQSGIWRGIMEALAEDVTAIAPDMPGHGRSAPWDGRDIHDLVTGMAEELLEDGMHVVGHSFGATVALRLAEAHPGRIASLTLIEPVLFAAARETAPEAYAANIEAGRPTSEAFAAGDLEEAARLFTGRWGGGADWSEIPAEQRARMASRMPQVMASGPVLTDDAKGLLAPGALERVAMRALLLRGEASEPVMAGICAGLLARLPDGREEVVPGAGHMLTRTHAQEVAALLGPHMGAG